jgi:hypothetical protein
LFGVSFGDMRVGDMRVGDMRVGDMRGLQAS